MDEWKMQVWKRQKDRQKEKQKEIDVTDVNRTCKTPIYTEKTC